MKIYAKQSKNKTMMADAANVRDRAQPVAFALGKSSGAWRALEPIGTMIVEQAVTNQVVDMGLLTQIADPPDGRQLGSRRIRQGVLALVNTGRFSPGRARVPVVN